MIKHNQNDYYTSKEAGKILGFSHDYIRRLIREGKVRGEKLGTCWIIYKREVEKFVKTVDKKRNKKMLEALNEISKYVAQAKELLIKFQLNNSTDKDFMESMELLDKCLEIVEKASH